MFFSFRKKGIPLVMITMLIFLREVSSIVRTFPIEVSPNTQSSPANFLIYFKLQSQLPSTGYLLMTISPFSVSAIPTSCTYLGSVTMATVCQNLQSATMLTINQTGINAINPNIEASKTIVMQFSTNLAPGISHSIQIICSNVLPSIGSITSSLQAYSVSGTGIMLEENWNFGQAYFQLRVNKILNVLSINSMINNQPGTAFSNLVFQITIGVRVPTPLSRMKLMINNDFTFLESALITTEAAIGSAPAPQLLSSVVRTKNIVIATFNQSFAVGRKFQLKLTNIQNPLKISSGSVSIYSLPYNSMSPLQIKQLSIPIQTVFYAPTVTVLTIQGLSPTSPLTFYTSTDQYIKVQIVLPRNADAGFVIQIRSDVLIIHEGSVYAVTSTVTSNSVSYTYVNSNTVRISGFPLVPSGSTIKVTMRVTAPATSLFNIYVNIDQESQINAAIMQGQAPTMAAIIPQPFITGLTGNSAEPNKLSWVKTAPGDSMMTFTVNPAFQVFDGSKLEIFVRNDLYGTGNFNGASSCTVGGTIRACTLVSNSTITTITIASQSSQNLFPQSTPTVVQVNKLTFNYASSHSQHIYHFYFKLTISQSTSSASSSILLVPTVLPQRNRMAGLANYFSNDLSNSGTNFPNVLRVVSTIPADWNYVIQSYQKRIMSIFSYQGWTSLLTTLKTGDSYLCGSNHANLIYTYTKGTTTNLIDEYPLDWDRIDIVLPGTQTASKLSVVCPTAFRGINPQAFQIIVGKINTNTREITYLEVQPRPVSGQPTYKNPAAVAISSKPKVATHKISLAGQAGSYMSNVQVTLDPSSPTYSAGTYQAALLTISNWQYYDSTSTFSLSSLNSVAPNPVFSLDQQSPISIKLGPSYFLTYIPIKTPGTYAGANFNIVLDNIKLPYTHDLPYYSIYLVDQAGTIDSYNQFINQDQNAFYQSYLSKLTMVCNDNSLGVINTYCDITLSPNNQIQVGSKIYISFTGMLISTNICELVKLDTSTVIDNVCSSNTDQNQLIVTMKNINRLPKSLDYGLRVYGLSILSNTNIQYIEISIRDPSGSYVIQSGNRIILTSVSIPSPISISQIVYIKNNPIVVSGFLIDFTLPRALNKDQSFALVFSNDLSNLNSISSKMKIKLYKADGTLIPALWVLNSKNYEILFENLAGVLIAGSYSMKIYGLKTPSSIPDDLIKLIYLRVFDHTYTVQNIPSSTATFPPLVDKINSLITLQTLMNTEGFQQQMAFTIINQNLLVDDRTVWYINFPRYYTPNLWHEDYLIYCTIQTSQLACERDVSTPYQITVHNSPRIIDVNVPYTITVYGIPSPRRTYLNGNAQYVTESIFLGIAETSTSSSFTEYSELFMTATIINPQSQPGYGIVTVTGISSSNLEAFQSTFFTVRLKCSNIIIPGQWIYMTFPEEFDNFNGIALVVQVQLTNTASVNETATALVVNTRLAFQLKSITIAANADFQVDISSLLTPKTAKIINMNKMKVLVASSDKLSTTAGSLELHNLVNVIQFLSTELRLVINNYAVIKVTAGTYTPPIKITTSNMAPFLSNMKVDFLSSAFSFTPQPTYMYLGENVGYFSIGCEQTVIPTTYAFDIIKTQASISSFYSSLSRYGVQVTNIPIALPIPPSINVPKGGCSIPIKIELINAPFNDLSIYFEYDTNLNTYNLFWMNQQVVPNELKFDKNTTQRWLSFCSDPSITVSNINVKAYLRGSNEGSYTLSPSVITITITANTTTSIIPTLRIVSSNVQKTYADFNVSVNLQGNLYYELKLAPLDTSMSIITLKSEVKQLNLTLQRQSDYLMNIYQSDRDHRINMVILKSGVNSLAFQNLLPEKMYVLCSYFENQHRSNTEQICINFTTQSWGTVMKAYITFNSTILSNQLNNIFCFFVKAVQSEIIQVVSLEGKSCALSNSPINYNFLYNGTTQSRELQKTIVYLFADKNLTTDPSISAFRSLYASSGQIQDTTKSQALSDFSINYIGTSTLGNSFTPAIGMNSDALSFQPSLSVSNPVYSSTSATISITSKATQAGTVYLLLTKNRKIIYNNVTGHSDVEIRIAITPSLYQLLNCLDGYGEDPINCARIVLHKDQEQSYAFGNISINSKYNVYYAMANEYPLRPIIYGNVSRKTIDTLNWEMRSPIILGLLTTALLIII